MISGTSKTWSKSGPVALLIITKMLQPIQENYGIILENIMYANMGLKQIESSKSVCPRYHGVSFSFCGKLSTYFENNSTKMRIGNDKFPRNKSAKAWR